LKRKIKLLAKLISIFVWLCAVIYIIINKDIIIYESFNLKFSKFNIIIFIIILHILFSVFILPCAVISILYGNILGLIDGIIISFSISFMTSIITFYLAQTKFNPFIFYNLNKARYFIEKNTKNRESIIVLLSFMNPLFPGSSLGYVFGITKISIRKYCILSFLGLIPLSFIMVFIGDTLGKLD